MLSGVQWVTGAAPILAPSPEGEMLQAGGWGEVRAACLSGAAAAAGFMWLQS